MNNSEENEYYNSKNKQESQQIASWCFAAIVIMMLFSALYSCVAKAELNLTVDPFTKTQVAAEVAYSVLLLMDRQQTIKIMQTRRDNCYESFDMCRKYTESNPLIGQNASAGRLNSYFLGVALIHLAITAVLPSNERKYWQGITLVVQADTVRHNRLVGIRWNF